nr:hypothetical protein [Actinomycetota bacterium]
DIHHDREPPTDRCRSDDFTIGVRRSLRRILDDGFMRVGFPGTAPFCEVGRLASTNTSVRLPTANGPLRSGFVVVVVVLAAVAADAAGALAFDDFPEPQPVSAATTPTDAITLVPNVPIHAQRPSTS